MREFLITEDQRKRGREVYEFNVLKGSVTEGNGSDSTWTFKWGCYCLDNRQLENKVK